MQLSNVRMCLSDHRRAGWTVIGTVLEEKRRQTALWGFVQVFIFDPVLKICYSIARILRRNAREECRVDEGRGCGRDGSCNHFSGGCQVGFEWFDLIRNGAAFVIFRGYFFVTVLHGWNLCRCCCQVLNQWTVRLQEPDLGLRVVRRPDLDLFRTRNRILQPRVDMFAYSQICRRPIPQLMLFPDRVLLPVVRIQPVVSQEKGCPAGNKIRLILTDFMFFGSRNSRVDDSCSSCSPGSYCCRFFTTCSPVGSLWCPGTGLLFGELMARWRVMLILI